MQAPDASRRASEARAGAAAAEWIFHKTPDDSHPDGNEQQMLWLMNRARSHPDREGLWLATSNLADIAGGRDYFDVDRTLLQEEFSWIAVKPPAAFDVRLYYAAQTHSEDMIARDSQDHEGQFDAISANGFSFSAARGNVFYYAASALNAHAAFNIDWGGSDGTGMQTGRGHRLAIMAIDGDYTNVGLAVVDKPDGNSYDGFYAVTGDYCQASTGAADHYNRFLVGTVWEDLNGNEMYDPGEGLAGVRVSPGQGAYYAITATSGGYAVPLATAGDYDVAFSGDGLGGSYLRPVTVGGVSVLLDLCVTYEPPLDDPFDSGDPTSPVEPHDPGAPTSPDSPQQETPQPSAAGGGSGCFIGILQ